MAAHTLCLNTLVTIRRSNLTSGMQWRPMILTPSLWVGFLQALNHHYEPKSYECACTCNYMYMYLHNILDTWHCQCVQYSCIIVKFVYCSVHHMATHFVVRYILWNTFTLVSCTNVSMSQLVIVLYYVGALKGAAHDTNQLYHRKHLLHC